MNGVSLVELIRLKFSTITNEFRNNCLYYAAEKLSVEELSVILGTTVSEITDYFWKREQIISKNQYLPTDWLVDYCQSQRIKLRKKKVISWDEIIENYLTEIDKNTQLSERPPIVSIMGHIDHGKTTLLDTIHHTQLQGKEAGGITQKITVLQGNFQGKKITFLDTPGHSDFIKMRQKGFSLTDIVILVISAGEGTMSQTEEIINYLSEYKIPVIVFINHKKPAETDNEVNLNRIKSQCQEKGLVPLDWGGDTIFVSGNAKDEKIINYLCENILLLADYKVNWQRPANGVIIDSYRHPQSGVILTELLVQGGHLQEKDEIFLNGKFGSVKVIFNIHNQKIPQAFPSDLVRLVGLNFLAKLGDKFLVIENENTKNEIEKELNKYSVKKSQVNPPLTSGKKNINLVLLADSQNSLEVLTSLVEKTSNSQVNFSIIFAIVGKLNNFSLDLAKITQGVILAFGCQFSPPPQSKILREKNIPFFSSKIIYEITDQLARIIVTQNEKKQVEKTTGIAQISQVFYYSKVGGIAGCQVLSGKITRNNLVRVFRVEKEVFTGAIRSLESNKINVKEVSSGQECGIVLKGFNGFLVGDKIIGFQMLEENIFAK